MNYNSIRSNPAIAPSYTINICVNEIMRDEIYYGQSHLFCDGGLPPPEAVSVFPNGADRKIWNLYTLFENYLDGSAF